MIFFFLVLTNWEKIVDGYVFRVVAYKCLGRWTAIVEHAQIYF